MNELLLLDNIVKVLAPAWPEISQFVQPQLEGMSNFQNNIENSVYELPIVTLEIMDSVDWNEGALDVETLMVTIDCTYMLNRKDSNNTVNGRIDGVYGLRDRLSVGRQALIANEPTDGTWQLIPPFPTTKVGFRAANNHWLMSNMDSILSGCMTINVLVQGYPLA